MIAALRISAALMLATGAVHYEVVRTIAAVRRHVQFSHRTELLGYVAAAPFAQSPT